MNILVITNLYPLPWEPNRATFNKQQFDKLSELHHVKVIVPIAWPSYIKNIKKINLDKNKNVKYICQFYTPGFCYKYFGYFMYLSIMLSSWSWIKSFKPKCILGSWAFPDAFSAKLIAQKMKIPFFVKVHGSDINILTTFEDRKKHIQNVCQDSKHIIAVSDALRMKLIDLGVSSDKITRIYNGVDQNFFYQELNPSNKLFNEELLPWVFVGNLKKDKGVFDLIKAFSNYQKKGGLRKLVIIGDGTIKLALHKLIKEQGLSDSVKLLGAMVHSEAASIVRNSFCLILPSYHEGVPNVLLEAANCGIPVIATRVGGIPEVVIENKTGVLVEAGDVVALGESMIDVDKKFNFSKEDIVSHGKKFTWFENIKVLNKLLTNGIENN